MKKIIILFILSITLTGCWDQKIYEKTGFILQVGIESGKDSDLQITYNSPVIGEEIKEQVEIVEVEANLLREARENARMISPKTLEGGKIQQVLISKELAEKGISELFDVFNRDPILPTLALVVIVDGSPYEMMKKTMSFEDKPRASFYINELLEGNIKNSYLPETRIWNFSAYCLASGIDPISPMLKLDKTGIITIGSAIYSEDKMVGRIDSKQTSLLLAMMGKLRTTHYITNPSPKDGESGKRPKASVLIKKAKSKISVKILNNKPTIHIDLKMDGYLDEYREHNINEKNLQEKLEEDLSKMIEEECDKLLKYLVSVGSDPLGIGDIIRAKNNSYWQGLDWKEVYKEAAFNISVKLDIKQFGTTE